MTDLSQFKGPDPRPGSTEGGIGKQKKKREIDYAKGTEQTRDRVRNAKGQECRVCGVTARETHIHLHHIIRQGSAHWPSFMTENNIVGLCSQCHTDLHNGKDATKESLRRALTRSEVEATDRWAYSGYVDEIYFRLRRPGRNPGTLEEAV